MPSPSDGNLKGVDVRLAAAAAAAGLVITSSGEVVLLGILLAIAGGQVLTAAIALVVALAMALRWGATSLDAIAGAQSVLGPAAIVGSLGAAASAWFGGLALVLASPRGWTAPAFGLAAALAVAGPAVHDAVDLVIRVGAAGLGVALAMAAGRWAPPNIAPFLALGLAVLSSGLALLA